MDSLFRHVATVNSLTNLNHSWTRTFLSCSVVFKRPLRRHAARWSAPSTRHSPACRRRRNRTQKLAERDSLTLARVGLLKLRGSWGAQYAADLLAAFSTPAPVAAEPVIPVTPSKFAALGAAGSGFAALSLVDDAQITQDIEFARLSQQLRLQVEPVMADLDALVCAAQGLDRVQPELNGLRPEVFADVLRGLLNGTNVEPDIRALWLKGLAVPMGRELRGIYDRLIAQLAGRERAGGELPPDTQPVGCRCARCSGSSGRPGSRGGADGGGWGSGGGSGTAVGLIRPETGGAGRPAPARRSWILWRARQSPIGPTHPSRA